MSQWIWSGQTALLWGSVAFALLFVPAVVVQYRRCGDWNLVRLAGTFALSLYGTALVTYTWLPLPPRDPAWCAANAKGVQLVPFRMFADIADAAARRSSVPALLTDVTLLQVVFNVLLFVPLGLIVRRYWHRSFTTAVVAGFITTLVIEATQFTGLWGFYPCAYRFADIDDVIANTTGAVLGAALAPVLLWWMPDARLLAAARLHPRPVTALRRWTGQLIDVTALGAMVAALQIAASAVSVALGWSRSHPASVALQVTGVVLAWVVVCVLPPWRHLAASPGQLAVWLTPVWRTAPGVPLHGTRLRRLGRANLSAGPFLLWLLTASGTAATPPGGVVWMLLLAASIVLVPLTRTKRSLSGLVTGAEFVDIRSLAGDAAVAADFGGFLVPDRSAAQGATVAPRC